MRTWDDEVLKARRKGGVVKEIMDMANTMGQIAGAVYYVRNELGISRRRLAEQAGVSYASIVRLEEGATSPRIDTVVKILSVLGLKIRASSDTNADPELKEMH